MSDWLLESDIHFILSHPNQGMLVEGNYDWTAHKIKDELYWLKCHHCFPNGMYLTCPNFLQDKWEYIVAVKGFTLPTLKVPIPINLENPNVQERIQE